MRHSIWTILLTVLIISLNGCTEKGFGIDSLKMPKISIPSLNLQNLKLDRSLPTVQGVKIKSSLSEVALEWKPVRKPHVAGYRWYRYLQAPKEGS